MTSAIFLPFQAVNSMTELLFRAMKIVSSFVRDTHLCTIVSSSFQVKVAENVGVLNWPHLISDLPFNPLHVPIAPMYPAVTVWMVQAVIAFLNEVIVHLTLVLGVVDPALVGEALEGVGALARSSVLDLLCLSVLSSKVRCYLAVLCGELCSLSCLVFLQTHLMLSGFASIFTAWLLLWIFVMFLRCSGFLTLGQISPFFYLPFF